LTEVIIDEYIIDNEGNGELKTGTSNLILDPGEKCDKLLQEFHRFDEGLGIAGKWAGGSVTGVCRGWGTSKVRTNVLLFYLRTFNINMFVKLSLWSLVPVS